MRVSSKRIKNKGLFKHLIIEIEYKVGSLNMRVNDSYIVPKNALRQWIRKNRCFDNNDNEDITKDNEWFPEHTFALKFSLCSHT